MSLNPYLFFNGNCREALEFYAGIFGGTPDIMTADGMPPEYEVPDDQKDWIMHGSLKVRDGLLMASDTFTGTSDPMAGCGIQLDYPTSATAKEIFDKLADGGEITMAWEPTFWSAGFGTVTDKFGIRWMIGCDEAPAAA